MLFIGGGRNGGDAPEGASERMATIAKATGTVVAELGMVPNQPLTFHGDGQARTEDDLIGYAWDQYLLTGEPRWAPRNAMVKSAVRAMDAVTEVMASDAGGNLAVDRFVVAGGSKRGWTTWLTGLDERVVAIVPIVIDVLNVDPSMRHHFAAYGFWAPSIGNYVAHGIMQRLDHPRLAELYRLVDPYYYRHRLTMPKLVLNAAGDQFFVPDSWRFYWQDLRGENYLRYVPNGDHGLDGTDALETLVAFHTLMANGIKPPQYSWSVREDGSLVVLTQTPPREVRLWQAHNPEARDFRVETLGRAYTSTVLSPTAEGLYQGHSTYAGTRLDRLVHRTDLRRRRGSTAQAHHRGDGDPGHLAICRQATRVADFGNGGLPGRHRSTRRPKSESLRNRWAISRSIPSDGLSVVTLGERVIVNWTPGRADGAGQLCDERASSLVPFCANGNAAT